MTDFTMVHPLVFKANPLIQKIASDPWWTMSDNEKRPIHAVKFLETGNVYNARFDEGHPLVTLDALDADPNLDAVNRAYRLRARENRVMMIDVEPSAPLEMKQQVLAFPAHYTELSKNGGVHLLIEVPADMITNENRYLFDDLSVLKEPVPKDAAGKQSRQAHYEILLNDHYVTFTKKMDTAKRVADFENDPNDRAALRSFLENIVQLDAERKAERERAKAYRVKLAEDAIDDARQADIQTFLKLRAIDIAREQAAEKSITDYGGDGSRYEMGVANSLAYHILRTHKMASETTSFHELAARFDEEMLIHATYQLLQDAVPYRDKHDEDRDGLPWLLYTAKRAYEYMKAQNSKR